MLLVLTQVFYFESLLFFNYRLSTSFFLLGLFVIYFSACFTHQWNNCLELKTISLPCISEFRLTSQDEDEDGGCGVCETDSKRFYSLSKFFVLFLFFLVSQHLLQYFLFETLLSLTVSGLVILLQRKFNWTVL